MQDAMHYDDAQRRDGNRAARRGIPAEQTVTLQGGIDAMWGAVQRQGLTRVSAKDLCSEVRIVAVSARREGVLPEKFLSIIKESWTALPEVRSAPDPDRAREQLSGIITLCIREYYRD